MKTINIAANTIKDTFIQLNTHLGGAMKFHLNEYTIAVDSELGNGQISGMKLKGEIMFLQINMTFTENIKLVFNMPKKSMLNFAYCAEGKLSHSFGQREQRTELEMFQTGILSNIIQPQNVLYFDRDSKVSASFISVFTPSGAEYLNAINAKLKEQFIDNATEDIAYVGSYNLKVAEQIKRLEAIKQDGVVRTLLVEGLVHVILALEIEQHKKDIENAQLNTGSLSVHEMSKIKDLSDFINNYPETSLTVSELSRKIGLTPSKVQEGFKLMHNRTVNDFIRDVRVTKSEELIKTTDLNISQILYTLGFSSRSYFSKIFKEKFNCSPSQYKAQIKLAATA